MNGEERQDSRGLLIRGYIVWLVIGIFSLAALTLIFFSIYEANPGLFIPFAFAAAFVLLIVQPIYDAWYGRSPQDLQKTNEALRVTVDNLRTRLDYIEDNTQLCGLIKTN